MPHLPALLLAALLVVLQPAAASADPPPPGTVANGLPHIHYVAARFPPYTLDHQDRMAGPTRDLLVALAERVGRPSEPRLLPLARALSVAEHEADTLVALIARTPPRETRFHWVCPVLDYDVQVFRHRDRPDIRPDSIADLKSWQLAGANRDVKTNYLLHQGLPVTVTADEDEAMRLVLHGRAELMPSHPASLLLRLREAGLPADTMVPVLALPELTSRLYLAFGIRTAPAVAAAFATACAAMIADGTVARLLQPAMLN